jgi:arylsulfatase
MGHMTGRDNDGQFPAYSGDLSKETRTIAEILKPAGYRNYAVGKWHVCNNIANNGPKHNWPLSRGFDTFYGMVSGGGSFFDPWTLCRDNTLISPFADPDYKPETYYFTDAVTDHAVRNLKEHASGHAKQPFFMYVAYTAAHWPLHALPADIAKYKGAYDKGYEPIAKARYERAARQGVIDPKQPPAPLPIAWESVANKKRESACMEVYAAMVDRMDQGIGKIVATLKEQGNLDNTLIVYLQDNGACAEDQGRNRVPLRLDGPRPAKPTLLPRTAEALSGGLIPIQTRDGFPVRQGPSVMPGDADTYVAYGRGWAAVGNTPFREYKHWVHEGGISTPLVAHWPASIKAKGAIRNTPGHLIDIMATCVDISGAEYPKAIPAMEGRSLVPVFAGRRPAERPLFWEHEGNRAVSAGDWKAVAKGPAGNWELYNTFNDRVESRDLAQVQPNRLRYLVTLWEGYAQRTGVLPWVWDPPYKPLTP